MDDFFIRKINRKIINDELDWVCQFKVEDYVDNPPMILKLYEEKQSFMAIKLKCEKEIENLKQSNHNLELRNERLDAELKSIKSQKYLWYYILSLIPPVLIGVGVNFITSEDLDNTVGWGIILIGIFVKVIEFFLPPKKV